MKRNMWINAQKQSAALDQFVGLGLNCRFDGGRFIHRNWPQLIYEIRSPNCSKKKQQEQAAAKPIDELDLKY